MKTMRGTITLESKTYTAGRASDQHDEPLYEALIWVVTA